MFATTSGWPASTAASTANSAATGSNRTSSVASMTGRVSAETDEACSRGCWGRTVNISFGMKLPARRARRRPPDASPPKRQIEEDPEKGCYRSKKDEAGADED